MAASAQPAQLRLRVCGAVLHAKPVWGPAHTGREEPALGSLGSVATARAPMTKRTRALLSLHSSMAAACSFGGGSASRGIRKRPASECAMARVMAASPASTALSISCCGQPSSVATA